MDPTRITTFYSLRCSICAASIPLSPATVSLTLLHYSVASWCPFSPTSSFTEQIAPRENPVDTGNARSSTMLPIKRVRVLESFDGQVLFQTSYRYACRVYGNSVEKFASFCSFAKDYRTIMQISPRPFQRWLSFSLRWLCIGNLDYSVLDRN